MKKYVFATILAMPAILSLHAVAQAPAAGDSRATSSATTVAPDNTKSNKLDPSNRVMTADKQANNATDLDLTKRIRESVIADKSLSTNAHNVKIVAVGGTVTLNGVVMTADEKTKIEGAAASIAGKDHVVNRLKVKADQ